MPTPKSIPIPNISVVSTPTTISNTVAANTYHAVVGLSLANTSNAPITASVKLVKNGGTSAFMLSNATIAVGGTEVVVGGDQKTFLEAGDSIVAYASAANSCDAVVSYAIYP